MKAKTKDKDKIPQEVLGGTGLGGRHCVEPRVCLLFSLFFSFSFFSFWNEWRVCFFFRYTPFATSIKKLLTSSIMDICTSRRESYLGIYQEHWIGSSYPSIQPPCCHRATTYQLLVLVLLVVVLVVVLLTIFIQRIISTQFRVPVSESVLRK